LLHNAIDIGEGIESKNKQAFFAYEILFPKLQDLKITTQTAQLELMF
jgi:hypothetical protein